MGIVLSRDFELRLNREDSSPLKNFMLVKSLGRLEHDNRHQIFNLFITVWTIKLYILREPRAAGAIRSWGLRVKS